MRGESGFSLVEVLVASALTTGVTLLACWLAMDAQRAARTDGARVDLHQRVRVAADSLSRALMEAGAGPHSGAARGPLIRSIPPIVPRRTGLRDADPPTAFRPDVFTVVRAVAETESAVLALPAAGGTTALEIAPFQACALPACGFAAGMAVLLTDAHGQYDIFTVTAVAGMALSVRHHGPGNTGAYPAGVPVLAVSSSSYAFDTGARLLRVYNGDTSDMPLMDDVVGMEVGYYGDVQPPVWPKAAAGAANCLYDTDGDYFAALMPVLGGAAGVTPLTPTMLTDGPWCGAGSTRFDADLLRVRRVRVTLRLQAADPAVRGLDSRFRRPGSARDAGNMVADATVTLDVSPRNLVQGW
jgi:hypothetical protein